MLEYSSDIAPTEGMSHGGKITLLPDLPPAEAFAMLVHEVWDNESAPPSSRDLSLTFAISLRLRASLKGKDKSE